MLRLTTLQIVVLEVLALTTSAAALEIKQKVNGSEAIITADVDRFAGAINSFVWNGREFLDSTDHGRELQSAVSFDGLGECFNPTEAGSVRDGRGLKSSSRVVFASAKDGAIKTTVDAAFWLAPGTPVTRGCGWGKRPDVQSAVNENVTSGYLISKKVRFGIGKIQNALDYKVSFTYPVPHSHAQVEILTAYLPMDFDNLGYFSPESRSFVIPERKPFQQLPGYPVFSTADENYAFGLLCRKSDDGGQIEYWAWRFERAQVVKWTCFSQVPAPLAKNYSYRGAIIFGTLSDVLAAMSKLSARY